MSFGGGNDYNRGINNLGGISQQAQGQLFPAAFGAGQEQLNAGTANTASGANFFNTLLHGNRQNTTALLQPDINRIQGANQGTLQAVSTLMPRGGGRSGTLFNLPFQQNQQIQGLYGPARSAAAGQLANIGMGQTGMGTNLFNVGNQALGTGVNASSEIAKLGLQQKQMSNQMAAGLANGILGLAMTPFGGGSGLFGMFGKGAGGGGGY